MRTQPPAACLLQTQMSQTWPMRNEQSSATFIPSTRIQIPKSDASITDELPVDVALGKVDYIEVMGFSDHSLHRARPVRT